MKEIDPTKARNCDCKRSQDIWFCICDKSPNVILLNSEQNPEECDARDDDQGTEAGNKKIDNN